MYKLLHFVSLYIPDCSGLELKHLRVKILSKNVAKLCFYGFNALLP